ncbi:hypothetical protein [Lysobacter gummosus]|uniref:hypothetical protein n=1 Tax=Lysobacter gummosus TaxID=262324 RepID=UPI00363B469A
MAPRLRPYFSSNAASSMPLRSSPIDLYRSSICFIRLWALSASGGVNRVISRTLEYSSRVALPRSSPLGPPSAFKARSRKSSCSLSVKVPSSFLNCVLSLNLSKTSWLVRAFAVESNSAF